MEDFKKNSKRSSYQLQSKIYYVLLHHRLNVNFYALETLTG